MPRLPTWGTPARTQHYLQPRPALRYVVPSLGAGLVLCLALLGAQVVGWRGPVSPGQVISPHSPMENRCEECHQPRHGASNLRCQRCHDPSGAGRLTNATHVLFGSGSPAKAAAAPNLQCASCHVEHRGRTRELRLVDQTHCEQCHFRGLSSHPEFAVLRTPSVEVPGLRFPHLKHMQELAKQGVRGRDACLRCHQPAATGRDLQPISFDRHCAACHAKEGSLGTLDPISQEDVMTPDAILAAGGTGDWLHRAQEYDLARGKVAKTVVRHRDEWVLYNLARLRRQVDPQGFEAERAALLARLSQLQRRQALATPLAALDTPSLESREATLEMEQKGAEARLAAQATAQDPGKGLARLDDVLAAATAAGDAAGRQEADDLRQKAQALGKGTMAPAALPADDFEERRRELLSALDAVDAADPAMRARSQDLRRRLLALIPGEEGADVLKRVRDAREAEVARVRDEMELRRAGVASPPGAMLAGWRVALEDAVADTRARLVKMSVAAPPAVTDPERLQGKKEAAQSLAGACIKCHVLNGAAFERVAAARPVLVRGLFVHQPHLLQADCARCHAGVENSRSSRDLNFKGMQSCRECHAPGAVSQDCQTCHRYHPPAVF